MLTAYSHLSVAASEEFMEQAKFMIATWWLLKKVIYFWKLLKNRSTGSAFIKINK